MMFPSHLFTLFAVGIILWPIAGGVAGALIAQSKNRSALEGALLGIFLGWIGIVVEVVLPTLPENERPRTDRRRAFRSANVDTVARHHQRAVRARRDHPRGVPAAQSGSRRLLN